MKTSILDCTQPFTGASFIYDCLLSPCYMSVIYCFSLLTSQILF